VHLVIDVRLDDDGVRSEAAGQLKVLLDVLRREVNGVHERLLTVEKVAVPNVVERRQAAANPPRRITPQPGMDSGARVGARRRRRAAA
jgi:hypothetical protein